MGVIIIMNNDKKELVERKIKTRLKTTGRSNVKKLISYLEAEKFFEKPASINHHSNYKGGLAEHSLLTLKYLKHIYRSFKDGFHIPEDSLVIEGLLHDLCKIDCYEIDTEPATDKQEDYLNSLIGNHRLDLTEIKQILVDGDLTKSYASSLIDWLKNDGQEENKPEQENSWSWSEDSLSIGHGEKSIILAQEFIEMKEREMMAIRWHMGAWEDGVAGGSKNNQFDGAVNKYPDVQLLVIADQLATFHESWVNMEVDNNEDSGQNRKSGD